MATLQHYRGYVFLTLLFGLAFGGYVLYDRRPQPEPMVIVTPTSVPTMPTATVAPTATPAPIVVHVAGAVAHPGVYTLPANSRLVAAVDAAGGLAENADADRINLADHMQDGQQIYVPAQGTPAPPLPTPLAGATKPAAGPPAQATTVTGLVNINTATVAELDTLPGIGPAYAQRIIDYREANGPFTDPRQVLEIKGIGEKTYEQIQDRITIQ